MKMTTSKMVGLSVLLIVAFVFSMMYLSEKTALETPKEPKILNLFPLFP